MGYTVVPDKATGDVFTETNWDLHIRDNINTGIPVKLAETVLAVDTASITFSAIPQTHKHLELVIAARAASGGFASGWVRFNGDTGANYDSQTLDGNGAATGATQAYGQTAGTASFLICGTALFFGAGRIQIPDYTNTARHKVAQGFAAHKFAQVAGGLFVRCGTDFWRSTAAVTSITLSHSSAINLAAGTVATLYGMP